MSTTAEKIPPETTEPEAYVSVKEAARFLGMPSNTVYKMALARTIPSRKTGKLRRFKLSELAAFMESNRVEALPGR